MDKLLGAKNQIGISLWLFHTSYLVLSLRVYLLLWFIIDLSTLLSIKFQSHTVHLQLSGTPWLGPRPPWTYKNLDSNGCRTKIFYIHLLLEKKNLTIIVKIKNKFRVILLAKQL